MNNRDEKKCQWCQQTLSFCNWSVPGNLLHGTILRCDRCHLLYFKTGFNHILSDGTIDTMFSENDPITTALAPLEHQRLVILPDVESHEMILFSKREEHALEIVDLQIGSNRLDDDGTQILHELMYMSFVMHSDLRRCPVRRLFSVSFMGYMHDPRPVWEIPEVISWSYNTWRKIPFLPCLLTGDGFLGFSLAVCCGMNNKYVSETIKQTPQAVPKNPDPMVQFAGKRGFVYYNESVDAFTRIVPIVYASDEPYPYKHWRVKEADERIMAIYTSLCAGLIKVAGQRGSKV